jgi:EmrB/QacA subfamily drug resistance transporter
MSAAGADTAPAPSGDASPVAGTTDPRAEHRRRLEMLSGLLLALFVGILSSTIVSNALPRIIHDLHGSQAQYTWVVSASLLAMTATTVIWGKLADLFSKKLLVQLAILIFVAGSVLCGISQNTEMLIGFRVVQGIGMGGLQALVQVVIAVIIPPRERGRYMGYLGAVMAVATVGGPLIGGVIVDTPWLGWRWTFYVGVPIAAIALVVLQKTLTVPLEKRQVKIDYLGALLIAGGVALLLVWTSMAGHQFDWISAESAYWVGGGVLALILAVVVETRAAEPVVPLKLFRDRTTVLAVIASVCVGVAMFGTTVFLSQYFQLSRGASPTKAGIMTLPMVISILIASTGSGQLISRLGRWKIFLVAGTLLLTAGLSLYATMLSADTAYWKLAIFMALVGLGVGMSMQNLVLAVQNTVSLRDLGSASSTVTFFRNLGGSIGVSVLGAVLAGRVTTEVTTGLDALGVPPGTTDAASGGVPSLAGLPAPVREVITNAYGVATEHSFLIAAPMAFLAFVAVLFIREIPLRRTIDLEPAAGSEIPATGAPDAGFADTDTATRPIPVQAMAVPDPGTNGAGTNGAGTNGAGTNGAGTNGAGTNRAGAHHRAEPPPQPAGRVFAAADGGSGPAVYGTVSRGDHAPLPQATLTLTDLAGVQVDRSASDNQGRYRLAAPDGGTFLVVCASGAYQPQASLVAVADRPVHHDIGLAGSTTLVGLVHAGAERAGVPGVAVTLIDVQGNVAATAHTDSRGHYRFDALSEGSYTLTAAGPGFQPLATTVGVGPGLLEHDIELPVRTRLVGTVCSPSARPIAEALATLVDATGTVVASATTDADGTFAIDDLPEGSYTVTATAYAPAATQVQLSAGEPGRATLTLAPPRPVGAPSTNGAPTPEHGIAVRPGGEQW